MYSNDASATEKCARLLSPYVSERVDYACLQFDYYMFGTDVDRMNFILVNGQKKIREIWEQNYDQGDTWRRYSKTLKDFSGQIIVEGWTSLHKEADLAIDNIRISQGSCDTDEGTCLRRSFRKRNADLVVEHINYFIAIIYLQLFWQVKLSVIHTRVISRIISVTGSRRSTTITQVGEE